MNELGQAQLERKHPRVFKKKGNEGSDAHSGEKIENHERAWWREIGSVMVTSHDGFFSGIVEVEGGFGGRRRPC